MMRKYELISFISDINDAWSNIVRMVDSLRHPNYPIKLDRQELHNQLKKNNQWMIQVCKDFYTKYSSDPRIIFNNYVFNNLYSIILSSPDNHIFIRFPYDLLVILTEREHEFEYLFSPLISLPAELKADDYNLSFDNVLIHLQSLLDSSKKHITEIDKDHLQGFINYRKRLNEAITSRINPLPPKKSDILVSQREERSSTWRNYIRYYHESMILDPRIIINPLYNNKIFIREYSKHDSQANSDNIMKFKLDDSNLLFSNKLDNEEDENSNSIRKIMINTMLYEFEPKSIHPPSTYIKDRYSVEIKPVTMNLSSEDIEILKFYKFLNEKNSLLEHKNLQIGRVERFIPRKLPVKLSKVKNVIATAFQKNILYYYPRINYINLTRKRLLRIRNTLISKLEEEKLSNLLKQFPSSVHFLGEKENLYFIKLSDQQDAILHDTLIEYFPSLENEFEITEFSYPEPDLVLSAK